MTLDLNEAFEIEEKARQTNTPESWRIAAQAYRDAEDEIDAKICEEEAVFLETKIPDLNMTDKKHYASDTERIRVLRIHALLKSGGKP